VKFLIGKSDSKSVKVDAMVLADTRGLICASSGLGKSWLLRLIAEAVASSVQTVIIDPEGEFSTLREKLDVLIVSENGDLRADIRSAGLLARKLAETGVSAVIDIYDLAGKEDPWVKRRMFVSQLIGELMNLPKKLYHPMLVMVDEAHQFAQEETISDTYILNGVKVNPSILSRSAIRSLMSAGRKRGIGGILATQRISKIDKDAIADARNVFIGGTTLDIDQRRAGDILGMSKSEFVSLRDLEPGTFFAFGPAVEGKGIVQFTSSKVQTTHPKAGQRSSIVVPKASTQIALIAEQFGDLPAMAEEEVKTLDALKRENVDLKRELRARISSGQTQIKTETKIERVEVPVLHDEQFNAIMKSLADLNAHAKDIKAVAGTIESYPLEIEAILGTLKNAVEKYSNGHLHAFRESVKAATHSGVDRARGKDKTVKTSVRVTNQKIESVDEITGPMQRILDAIAWLESIGIDAPKQVAVAFLAGYTFGGGAYNNPRGALRSAGLVEYIGSENIRLTEEGRTCANYPKVPLTVDEMQRHIMSVLPGPHQKILRVLIDKYPDATSKDECAALSGYAPDGGAFNNPMGRLHSMGLVDYPQPGYVVAESLLFLE
jgi:hypothetical protein